MIRRLPAALAAPATGKVAGHENMHQLVQLRWLAVVGQFVTIVLTHVLFHIRLLFVPMLGVLSALVLLNAASVALSQSGRPITNGVLFSALLLDVGALTAQLYLTGGATNPFISLFLLQVVLGAVLLDRWSSWAIVVATAIAFVALSLSYRPLVLPPTTDHSLSALHAQGLYVSFALVAVLLVMFVTRINGNLRDQERRLAQIRRQAIEEEHIVRMGLLASGAAHELGTPLSSLAVILGDWRRMDAVACDPDLVRDVAEMQSEVQRCKAIVTGILLSSGDPRGEAAIATTVRQLFDRLVADWAAARDFAPVDYRDDFGEDVPIAADVVLQQAAFNLLDNAAEASPGGVAITLSRRGDALVLKVCDRGPGFPPLQLANLGKPYNSSKADRGRGLGLYLASNVARKLGGSLTARNVAPRGAEVSISLSLHAIGLE